MITIYKSKKEIPSNLEYIELNDLFFNKNTAMKLDKQTEKIIKQIDETELMEPYKIKSKFSGVALDVDCLSTGCKTALNIYYFPEKVFCIKECGENALEVIYKLEKGSVYSDYATMPFEIKEVQVISTGKTKIIKDYEELKEWWENEEQS